MRCILIKRHHGGLNGEKLMQDVDRLLIEEASLSREWRACGVSRRFEVVKAAPARLQPCVQRPRVRSMYIDARLVPSDARKPGRDFHGLFCSVYGSRELASGLGKLSHLLAGCSVSP